MYIFPSFPRFVFPQHSLAGYAGEFRVKYFLVVRLVHDGMFCVLCHLHVKKSYCSTSSSGGTHVLSNVRTKPCCNDGCAGMLARVGMCEPYTSASE